MREKLSGFTFRILSIFLFLSAGTYVFAQSEDSGFFDEYLFGALHIDSYEPTYFMPFSMDFEDHNGRSPVEVIFQISFKKDFF